MENIDLSICPLLACNMNCGFCYIDKQAFDIEQVLDLENLYKVFNNYNVRYLDVYGGEITLLEEKYVRSMFDIIRSFHQGRIGLVSNGLEIKKYWTDFFQDDSIDIAFSVGNGRPYFDIVEKNILGLFYDYGIQYSLICLDIGSIPFESDVFLHAKSVSIKPYSNPSFRKNSSFIQKMDEILKFIYYNRRDIWMKLERIDKFRDDICHFFLMPDGMFYDITYDENGEFFTKTTNDIRVASSKCLRCQFYKKCFNEHYFEYDPADECIGRKDAMEFLNDVHDLY